MQFASELERKIASKFENLQDTATCIKARCPAHDDRRNSLCITTGANGSIILCCQAGCKTEEILAAVGLRFQDLYPDTTPVRKANIFYDYHDENGELLYQVLRTSNKEFFQVRTNPGDGLRVWGLTAGEYVKVRIGKEIGWRKPKQGETGLPVKYFEEQKKVLYRLPEVIQAVKTGTMVLIVEGEKDVENLCKQGFTATTSPGGAGNPNSTKKWRPEYNGYFQNAQVVILPDNDQPGREHAAHIASSLSGDAKSVRIVNLADLPEKGDVSDWLERGGTAEQLSGLIRQTPEYSKASGGQPLTDYGNAERLVERHGHNLRYVNLRKTWLVWDGSRWQTDETEAIYRFAKETVRSIRVEAEKCADPERAKKIFNFACNSESAHKIKAMVLMAQSEPEVVVTPKDLDRDNWRLNVLNGTLNLRTGKLERFQKSDLITKLAPVEFDPQAQCPLWLQFIDRVFEGNRQLIEFIQRMTGYILTGDVSEQVIFFLYGTGKNGKSRFVEALQNLLGEDYWKEALTSTLMYKKAALNNTNDIAMLAGKRLVTAVETEEGQRLAESLIKQMTGNDPITARFLYEENYTFVPTYKIFLITNHKPIIRGTDEGIWRRVRLIPFNVTIPEHERDKRLGEKLKAEYSGILNWMIAGCLKWQQDGLEEPPEVKVATDRYREEMDVLGDFIREYCAVAHYAKVLHSELYRYYKDYCEANNEYVVPSKGFSQKLQERGFGRIVMGKGGNKGWRGIGLASDASNYPQVRNDRPLKVVEGDLVI